MKKLLIMSLLIIGVLGSTELLHSSALLSPASLSESQMMSIRNNFATQAYYTIGALYNIANSCDETLSDNSTQGNGISNIQYWFAMLALYESAAIQDMYIYLYSLDESIRNDMEHKHAYEFRMYVAQVTGSTGYIKDLAPSALAMQQISSKYGSTPAWFNTGTSMPGTEKDVYWPQQMCQNLQLLYNNPTQ